MTVSLFGRAPGTWNEDAYFALPETSVKVELFDGDLLVSPPADMQHQRLSYRLMQLMTPRAEDAELEVYHDIGIRLSPLRILVPDVVIVTPPVDEGAPIAAATDVQLVVEVTSKSNAAVDRVKKLNAYASAGIPTYLLLDRFPTPVLRHFVPKGDTYVEQAQAREGDVLRLSDPIAVDIELTVLMQRRKSRP